MSILENIRGHGDLVCLNDAQREQLCAEIRTFLVDHIAETGGHLASNLGIVELSVAIETVFNTFQDRLVFDVGHQSYVHKLLTGRQADFDTLRQFGGIAGFPKPGESISDAFVAGHASSSVSISLGMARARSILGENYHVVTVIGDGATTGGMAYEGLNDAAVSGEPMVIILNDNEMSIDKNVGGMASHLSLLRTKENYLGMKRKYKHLMDRLPGGQALYHASKHVKDWVKRVLIPSTLFENMGLTYVGPVDGHDLPNLISLLRTARDLKRPVLLHVITQKGKGYKMAEELPSKFHGIGKFDPETGEVRSKSITTFSDVFGQTMCRLAADNQRLCAITAAMPGGTGLLPFKQQYPKRLFDVGIAEEHAVSMAGGLAKQNMIPVVALYSTFLQRSYDMLLQDVALLQLHVVLAIDRAGLVGEDGETHHGVFDVGFLRQIPGMRILCPASTAELQDMLTWSIEKWNGPIAVRYPRGGDRSYKDSAWDGTAMPVIHRHGSQVALITYGVPVQQAMSAAAILEAAGVSAKVIRLTDIGSIPYEALAEELNSLEHAFVLEEVCAGSGISADIAINLQNIQNLRIHALDLGKRFIPHGSADTLYQYCGLDADSICDRILEVVRHEN